MVWPTDDDNIANSGKLVKSRKLVKAALRKKVMTGNETFFCTLPLFFRIFANGEVAHPQLQHNDGCIAAAAYLSESQCATLGQVTELCRISSRLELQELCRAWQCLGVTHLAFMVEDGQFFSPLAEFADFNTSGVVRGKTCPVKNSDNE